MQKPKFYICLTAAVFAVLLCSCGKTAETEPTPLPSSTPSPTPSPSIYVSEETAERLQSWTDDLFEPETSITMSPTIIWPADENAITTAALDKRPDSVLLKTDSELNAYSADGRLLSKNLADYLAEIKSRAIPIVYLPDGAAAAAFSAFAFEYGAADIIVAADYLHADAVRTVCDSNIGIIGAIDWSGYNYASDRATLCSMAAETNRAHAKIMILSMEMAADTGITEYLHNKQMTVWGVAAADNVSVYTAITAGLNGIICTDYELVIECLESFSDSTTLLRHTLIAAHRGLSSLYTENTMRSARAAVEAGADLLELDVYMSADDQLFVIHDSNSKRLFTENYIEDLESLTLDDIQALTMRPSGGYGFIGDSSIDYVPSFDEYISAVNDSDVFFLVEIKTTKAGVIKALKEACERNNISERVNIITFRNGRGGGKYTPDSDILSRTRSEWSEISTGFLGNEEEFNIEANGGLEGIGAVVGRLNSTLQPSNSTCCCAYYQVHPDVLKAARHRGISSWTWTHNSETDFAYYYLKGAGSSITSDYAQWASDFPVFITVKDQHVSYDGGKLRFMVNSQDKGILSSNTPISLIIISGDDISMNSQGYFSAGQSGEAVCMLRLDISMNINWVYLNGTVDPNYSIYSQPFILTVG